MSNYTHIVINKNRGWRGLAEVKILDLDTKEQMKMIFSFSQMVWNDLIMKNIIVMQDETNYYIVYFKDTDGRLPKPTQQRSVLIKSFNATIDHISIVPKNDMSKAETTEYIAIAHFMKNKNNHTVSDWNCIGIRVTPEI